MSWPREENGGPFGGGRGGGGRYGGGGGGGGRYGGGGGGGGGGIIGGGGGLGGMKRKKNGWVMRSPTFGQSGSMR